MTRQKLWDDAVRASLVGQALGNIPAVLKAAADMKNLREAEIAEGLNPNDERFLRSLRIASKDF